jgi:hypothetical protein
MPLHDWYDLDGWEGVHHFWISELARNVKEQLPPGYRAYIGSGLAVATGDPPSKPDVSVRSQAAEMTPGSALAVGADESHTDMEPDIEIATATLEIEPSIFVERDRRLVAVVEVISLRNKDRRAAKTTYGIRYTSYLMEGVNLLLIDVHPRPLKFSFADFIAGELEIHEQPSLPAPMAIAYRVGEPAAQGGRFLAIWRYPLKPAEPLPSVALPLDVHRLVRVDLEGTYMRAARDAYLA